MAGLVSEPRHHPASDCDRVDLDTLHLSWVQPLRAVGGSHPSGQDGQPSLLRVTHSQGPDASVLGVVP